MDPRVDKLVDDLRHPDDEVRKKALNELSKLEDKVHAVAAIHWTMLNDVDDEIRRHARDIYGRIGEQQKSAAASTPVKGASRTAFPDREERRVHLKPTLGWPNPYGTWSIHFSLFSITLLVAAQLIQIPFFNEEVTFLQILRYIGMGFTIPGLLLGVLGLAKAGERKKSTPAWGLGLNGAILLISIWNLLMRS
jgi:hypothetical protein